VVVGAGAWTSASSFCWGTAMGDLLVVGDGAEVWIAEVLSDGVTLTTGAELGVWVTGCWFWVKRESPGDT